MKLEEKVHGNSSVGYLLSRLKYGPPYHTVPLPGMYVQYQIQGTAAEDPLFANQDRNLVFLSTILELQHGFWDQEFHSVVTLRCDTGKRLYLRTYYVCTRAILGHRMYKRCLSSRIFIVGDFLLFPTGAP